MPFPSRLVCTSPRHLTSDWLTFELSACSLIASQFVTPEYHVATWWASHGTVPGAMGIWGREAVSPILKGFPDGNLSRKWPFTRTLF